MGHTIATTFLPRSYCQTYAGYARATFLAFNRMAPRRIEHATLSFPGARNARLHTSNTVAAELRSTFPKLTQSTETFVEKTGENGFNSFLACVQSLLYLSVSLVSIMSNVPTSYPNNAEIQLTASLLVFYNAFLYILLGEKSVFPVLRYK